MINKKFFFDRVRISLFESRISSRQFAGLTIIMDAWDAKYSKMDDRWLAYALGTTHHETGRAMQPIHEGGGRQYFEWNYGIDGRNPKRARRMKNTQPGDGAKYHGRGFVQLTWRINYESMSRYLTTLIGKQVDLVSGPDLALQPNYAAEIMFKGMSAGSFTGKKFSDYFTVATDGSVDEDDWVGARAIINGQDKAQLIADYARRYYSALSHTV